MPAKASTRAWSHKIGYKVRLFEPANRIGSLHDRATVAAERSKMVLVRLNNQQVLLRLGRSRICRTRSQCGGDEQNQENGTTHHGCLLFSALGENYIPLSATHFPSPKRERGGPRWPPPPVQREHLSSRICPPRGRFRPESVGGSPSLTLRTRNGPDASAFRLIQSPP